eukprot:scaffold252154_cov32-Tisochrysis_lutea.AAC.1
MHLPCILVPWEDLWPLELVNHGPHRDERAALGAGGAQLVCELAERVVHLRLALTRVLERIARHLQGVERRGGHRSRGKGE